MPAAARASETVAFPSRRAAAPGSRLGRGNDHDGGDCVVGKEVSFVQASDLRWPDGERSTCPPPRGQRGRLVLDGSATGETGLRRLPADAFPLPGGASARRPTPIDIGLCPRPGQNRFELVLRGGHRRTPPGPRLAQPLRAWNGQTPDRRRGACSGHPAIGAEPRSRRLALLHGSRGPRQCRRVLRRTGARIEELPELTHLSLRQYQAPTGETVPLLQISPSKTDRERVIPADPDLVAILAGSKALVSGGRC